MSIEVTELRKALSFSYDTEEVKGRHATVLASNPNAKKDENRVLAEKKDVPNDGSFSLTFPGDYSGKVHVEIHGSSGGSDEGTCTI